MACWVGEVWKWKLKFRRPLYQWEEVAKNELEAGLIHIQLKSLEDDRIVWCFSEDGTFSTNSLMNVAMSIRKDEKNWEPLSFHLWSGLAPPKVEMFIWRIYQESLPCKSLLQRRKILRRQEDLMCEFCEVEVESADHLEPVGCSLEQLEASLRAG
ncbi:hypothetical protein QQ045_023001 [Rhodiola kirilowii]